MSWYQFYSISSCSMHKISQDLQFVPCPLFFFSCAVLSLAVSYLLWTRHSRTAVPHSTRKCSDISGKARLVEKATTSAQNPTSPGQNKRLNLLGYIKSRISGFAPSSSAGCGVPPLEPQTYPAGFRPKTKVERNQLGLYPDYAALSGVPWPEACVDFDPQRALPRPYRPFRWPYHQIMCTYL